MEKHTLSVQFKSGVKQQIINEGMAELRFSWYNPFFASHSTDGHAMDLLWVLYSMLTVCMAINMEATGSHSMFTCEPITLRMCQGLAYNTTFMPNLLNHYDQQTAALAMEVNHITINDVIKLHYINLGLV